MSDATNTPPMSASAQRAFDAYKALGPSRNLHKLSDVTGLAHNSLKKWQTVHKWREACAAHDAQIQGQVTAPLRASSAPMSPAEVVHEHTQATQKLYATLGSVLATINSTLEQAVTERDASLIRSVNALTLTAERLYKRSCAEHDKISATQKQSLERNDSTSRRAVNGLVQVDSLIATIRRALDVQQPAPETAGGDDDDIDG